MNDKSLDWRLSHVFENDDLDRLTQFLCNAEELLPSAWVSWMSERALRKACAAKATRCVDWLAKKLGDGRLDESSNAALTRAVWDGRLDVLTALLPHADRNHTNVDGETALMAACSRNMHAYVSAMIIHGDIDRPGRNKKTALMCATLEGSEALLVILPHADRSLRDKKGYNALMHAIENRNEEALAVLLKDSTTDEVYSVSKHKGAISAFDLAKNVEAQGRFKPATMIREEFARRERDEIQAVVSETSAPTKQTEGSNAPPRRKPRSM